MFGRPEQRLFCAEAAATKQETTNVDIVAAIYDLFSVELARNRGLNDINCFVTVVFVERCRVPIRGSGTQFLLLTIIIHDNVHLTNISVVSYQILSLCSSDLRNVSGDFKKFCLSCILSTWYKRAKEPTQ